MLNKAILVGVIDGDPELINEGTEKSRLTLFIKTTDTRADAATGQVKQYYSWHRVVVFGEDADNSARRLDRGSWILVDGKLFSKKWKDKNGNNQSSYEIVANSIFQVSSREGANLVEQVMAMRG